MQQLGSGGLRVTIGIQTASQVESASRARATACDVPVEQVSVSTVGPTWGGEVTRGALIGLLVFLAAVTLYLALRFEPAMAGAALIALLHDIVLTIGVYALVGFVVTPATVIALLTVLGLLFAGSLFLGAGTLKDLALAQFVGILAGTYSSLFIATPVLVQIQECRDRGRRPAVHRSGLSRPRASVKV